MNKPESPREILARADRAKRIANEADMAMVRMRLNRQAGEETTRYRRRWGILSGPLNEHGRRAFEPFSADLEAGIYEALRIVKAEQEAEARRLEASVTRAGEAHA